MRVPDSCSICRACLYTSSSISHSLNHRSLAVLFCGYILRPIQSLHLCCEKWMGKLFSFCYFLPHWSIFMGPPQKLLPPSHNWIKFQLTNRSSKIRGLPVAGHGGWVTWKFYFAWPKCLMNVTWVTVHWYCRTRSYLYIHFVLWCHADCHCQFPHELTPGGKIWISLL